MAGRGRGCGCGCGSVMVLDGGCRGTSRGCGWVWVVWLSVGGQGVGGYRAGRSSRWSGLPGLACLSCCSSDGEMKPLCRLSHCGLVDVVNDVILLSLDAVSLIVL